MRTFLYIFCAVALAALFFCNNCLGSEPDEILHKRCLYPTVKIHPQNKESYGTGVIVRSIKMGEGDYRNVFVTAAHVADSQDPYVVRVFEYVNWSTIKGVKTYPCLFYGTNEEQDIAVGVFMSKEKMPTAEFNFDAPLYIGTEVFHFGCGVGDEPRLDYGKITSVRSALSKSRPSLMRTSVQTVPGDSGGPLFHRYKLVGIAKSIRVWRDNLIFGISYYVPVERFVEWSDNNYEALHFAWRDRALPNMPFMILKFESEYEITKR
jgi:S1-C subfamily serine protease